ncbi:hypothetical protein JXC34_03940 [Candidatus Woesearchaeota archaeon]|nr:hypothetical protein [Candidatus Woesearchaeota archaeon]
MRVIHKLGERIVQGEGGNPGFLVSNKKGGYISLNCSSQNISAYQGWFDNSIDGERYKLIEAISLEKEPDTVKNLFSCTERHSSKSIERFYLFNGSLVYETESYSGACHVDFDIRRIYDFSDAGRAYKVYKKKGAVVVEYTKYRDHGLSEIDYRMYLAIAGVADFEVPDQWLKRYYHYDAQRGPRHTFYVYRGLKFSISSSNTVVFSFSQNEEEALEKAFFVQDNLHFLKSTQEKYNAKLLDRKKIEENMALKCLDDLIIIPKDESGKALSGVYAGFPWFYQLWARDELVSLGGIIRLKRYELAKQLLFKHLNTILPDGRLSNRTPFSELGSADSTGWLVKRLYDFMTSLESDGMLDRFLRKEDLEFIYDRLDKAILSLRKNFEREGLVWSSAKESWMDTDYGGDSREGACIEIQAFQLLAYSFMRHLGSILKKNTLAYATLEKNLAKEVKKKFFNSNAGMLADRFNAIPDFTQRPNIFLAYYIYPKLLKKSEWVVVFKTGLDRLWLDWGGLSSIAKDHNLFVPDYTGEDNRSYHRGDSWFYINNLAALCMHRLDKNGFSEHISKIIQAGTSEMLYHGFIGCCAEISPASHLESAGCFSQAWSAATLVELFEECTK